VREALELLEQQSTVALATGDDRGEPHCAPLFYVSDEDYRLYWFSSPRSQHSKNLKRDARAAATVYAPTDEWKEIRGLQMRGEAYVVRDRVLRRKIAERYVERFRLGGTFAPAMAATRLYCFEPSWIRYLDNTRGFGYRCTVKG
jgi:uncharacterized protein YhbP (UPF0306 family)